MKRRTWLRAEGRNFTRATFKIALNPRCAWIAPDDTGERHGLVCGPFSIHRDGRIFNVSHVPSGYHVHDYPTMREARAVVLRLLDWTAVDWASREPFKGLDYDARAPYHEIIREVAA